MDDIDRGRRRGGMWWLWVLVALLVLLLLWWWFWPDAEVVEEPIEPTAVETVEPVFEVGIVVTDVSLAEILDDPAAWYGRTFPDETLRVQRVPTDRAFMIEGADGRQLMAIIQDAPVEQPLDINPGQSIRISDGTLRNPAELGDLPGPPLGAATRQRLDDQQIVLVVDERNVEILAGGDPQPATDPAGAVSDTAAGGGAGGTR